MSEAQPLLSVRGVKTYYGKIIALKGVDVDVRPGEIVTMIGANGAGKSTLMMTIFGNPQAREGSITYDGRDITRMPSHEIARLGIASWKAAASLSLMLWLAFYVVQLSGAVIFDGMPLALGAVHAGDWLGKMLLIALLLGGWRKCSVGGGNTTIQVSR